MAVRNADWYAANATRAYPLDDAATARDDAGLELPSQVLVDCRIRFPLTLGQFAYVGAVTVSPSIVTAILMAAPGAIRPPGGASPGNVGIQPLGAVSLQRPVISNRHYPIQPMAAGVGGWLVFGRGIDEPYSGRFSTPGQSLLLPRVASAYHPLPIPSLGKLGVVPALTGVIQLLGATDLEVVEDTREIEGGIVDAIIIRLVDSLDRNVFSLYAGPCSGRPESGTCANPALQAINNVIPDCNGNLTIDFRNVNIIEFDGGGGLALDLPLGMADVCLAQDYLPDDTGKLPGDYTGDCAPPPPPGPCSTLLSYWKLNETKTGATAVDWGMLSANAVDNLGNISASTTAPIAAPTHFNNPHGRFFPASGPPGVHSSQTYLNAGIQPGHGFTNNFTVAAWVRCVGRVIDQPFVGHAAFISDGVALGWNLVSQQDGLLAFTSGLGGTTQDVPLTSEFTLPLNVWAHVAVVVTDDTIYLYFNGSKSVHTSKVLPGASPDVATCLGKDFTGIDNFEFNGDLDDVRIYNVALTDSEIQDLAGGKDVLVPCGPEVPPVQPPGAEGCVPIPYYESFDGALPLAWTVINGTFAVETDDSPGELHGLEGPQSGLTPGQIPGISGLPPLHRAVATTAIPIVPINKSYAATNQSQRNVSVWDCPFYDTSALPPLDLDVTCVTQLKLVAGPQINGGIIFDYFAVDPQFNNRPSYALVNVNVTSGYLSLDVYNGQSITMSVGFPFGLNGHGGVGDFPVVGDWYQLLVRVRVNPRPNQGDTWLVGLHLSGVTNPAFRGIDVDQPWGWGPNKPLGRFGLGSNNAHCLFSFFQLDETPAGGPP